jgi:cellulose synthase/poly-beta-1,6-N-acetylglucosamine synthase-like glycosyltransferase
VRLVAYDLDSPSSAGLAASPDGARTWVEVRKGGRVIGLVEPVARDGERSTLDLVELEAMSADAAARADDQVPDSALAAASVVIPTICANPAQLVRAVTSLLAMDYPDFDVIVVDNRTDPRAAPLPVLPGGPRVRTVAEPRPGISSARNRGTSVSTGEFVAFTDDDAVVDPGWLRAIGTRFAVDDTVDAVGGLVLPLELDTEPQLWFEEFYGGFSRSFQSEVLSLEAMRGTDELFPYAPGRFGAGCNMAFRRPVLDRLGGFDTTLGVGTPARGGEDLAMFFGLVATGATVAFEPGAVVRHSHRRTEAEFLRQVRSYGTGLTAMYTAMVVHEPRHLVEMLRRVPAGIRLLTRPRATRSTSRAPGYPRRTLAYQVLGMAYGPFAYARSAARARRYR